MRVQVPELAADTKWHGTEGPVYVSHIRHRTPIAEAFLEAGVELGNKVVDYNGETQAGYAHFQVRPRSNSHVSYGLNQQGEFANLLYENIPHTDNFLTSQKCLHRQKKIKSSRPKIIFYNNIA